MARRRYRDRFDLNADVNVVSLIDVMLLLLVIFMMTAPLMQGGIDIALPATQSKPLEPKEGLTITVNRAGEIFIDKEKYSITNFRVVFPLLAKNRTQRDVYLRADKSVGWGVVAQVMGIMRANGVSNVGLVTEPEEIP